MQICVNTRYGKRTSIVPCCHRNHYYKNQIRSINNKYIIHNFAVKKASFKWTYWLPGNDYRVATLPKSCQRNHHAKFEICRTILTFINDKRYLLHTYEWTDPSCRKSSLLKINSKHGLIKKMCIRQ